MRIPAIPLSAIHPCMNTYSLPFKHKEFPPPGQTAATGIPSPLPLPRHYPTQFLHTTRISRPRSQRIRFVFTRHNPASRHLIQLHFPLHASRKRCIRFLKRLRNSCNRNPLPRAHRPPTTIATAAMSVTTAPTAIQSGIRSSHAPNAAAAALIACSRLRSVRLC